MVDLEWYRTFKAIFECKSISEAAKRLYITQPGASKHLKALESQIGKKLFIRSKRKTLPTEFGKFLYTQIETPISKLENAEKYFSAESNKQYPSIVIGLLHDHFKYNILDKISSLDMFVTVRLGTQTELVKSLESGEIDLLVDTPKYSGFSHNLIKSNKERLVLVCSKGLFIPEALLNNKKLIFDWLNGQTWLAFDNELPYLKIFWNYHFNKNPSMITRYVIPSFEGLIEVLKKVESLCVMPSYVLDDIQTESVQLNILDFEPVQNQLYYSWNQHSESMYEIDLFLKKINVN